MRPNAILHSFLLAAIALHSSTSLTAAEQQLPQEEQFEVTGDCRKLTLHGIDLSNICESSLTSFQSATDDVRLRFWTERGYVDFSGRVEDEEPSDTRAIEIGRVTIFIGEEDDPPAVASAAGRCNSGDPSVGVTTIRCSGTSKGQPFSAEFRTDGSSPQ